MKTLTLALLALLTGCVAPAKPDEPATEPVLRLVPTEQGNYVCVAPDMSSEQWPAACAETGPWRRCIESATRLQCPTDGRIGA